MNYGKLWLGPTLKTSQVLSMFGVEKKGSSLDPVNLLSLRFGYCSPLVQ